MRVTSMFTLNNTVEAKPGQNLFDRGEIHISLRVGQNLSDFGNCSEGPYIAEMIVDLPE
ncbi:hypothetical protein KSC_105630 [Ktedonobacter sp. SOSP1-52]|nr:hypothetical protein KSC_105630 [Ktedonobacter sp. SOSP1-52]